MPMVRIEPRAANAFNIEALDFYGNIKYILEVNADNDRIGITAKSPEGEIIHLKATNGFYDPKGNEEFRFFHLSIKPLTDADRPITETEKK